MHMRAAKSLQGALDGEDAKQTYPHPSRVDTDISHVLRHRLIYWVHCPALECDTNYSPPVAFFVDDANSD